MMVGGDKDFDAPSCNGQRGVRSLFPKHTTVEIEASDFPPVGPPESVRLLCR